MAKYAWKKPGTNTWYTNVWDRARRVKIKKKVGPSKRQAEDLGAKIRANITAEDSGIPTPAKAPTLDEFIPVVLERRYKAKSCYPAAKRTLLDFRNFVGNRRLTVISKKDLHNYVNKRLNSPIHSPFRGNLAVPAKTDKWTTTRRVQESTANREVSYILCLFNRAVEWGYISASPMVGFKKFSEKGRARKRYLLPHEMRAFIEATPSLRDWTSRDILMLLLYTGRRCDEIFRLRKKDYDQVNGYLDFGITKKGDRDIAPIPHTAQRILTAALQQSTSEWMLPNRTGDGHVHDIRTAFGRVLKKAGITNFKIHDIRHTSCSYMVMAGMDFFSIAAIVGHTTPIMLQERYGHLSPQHRQQSSIIFGGYMDRLTGLGSTPVEANSRPPEIPIITQVANMISYEAETERREAEGKTENV